MTEGKNRHTVWLTDEAWAEVQRYYKEDNCSTLNEYIEKAIRFYSGYLDTDHAERYLPRVLAGILDGKLGALGDRVGRLLFKLAVESNIGNHILAADSDIDVDTYERLRKRSVREVQQTNGKISFKDNLIFQKSL